MLSAMCLSDSCAHLQIDQGASQSELDHSRTVDLRLAREWEQVAKEQVAKRQMVREQMFREQMFREQMATRRVVILY